MVGFTVPIRIGNLEKTSFAEVLALADTDSLHSYIPEDILESVGLRPTETRAFALTEERDEWIIDLPFGYGVFVVAGREVIVPVVFAANGSRPVLGMTTLEAAHLVADLVNGRLTPVIPPGRSGNGRAIRRG